MSKKTVTGEDGKTYTVKESKPWYKRFWVWVGIVLVVLIVGGAMGSSDDSSSSSSSDAGSTETSSKSEASPLDKTYKVGQTVTYKGYSFKVNKVSYYSGNEIDEPKQGNQYVIANVTITNKGDEKQDYNSYDFKLNANGNATDFDEILTEGQYSENTLDSGTLDTGASVSGNLVGQASTDSKLKLEYQPSFWDDETVDVNLN